MRRRRSQFLAVTQASCISGLLAVRAKVSEALTYVLFNLSTLLFFIACDILPGCALRLDGKTWPHPQTARLT